MQIPFLGLNHQANTTDGQFSVLVNLNPDRGGGLLPVAPPRILRYGLGNPDKVFIHGDRYLLYYASSKTLSYIPRESTTAEPVSISTTLPLISLTAIGNILICSTPTGLQYYRWNPDDREYTYLGNAIPTPKVDFGLQSMPVFEAPETGNNEGVRIEFEATGKVKNTKDNWVAATGMVNQFITKQTAKNKFIYPFFVCCAVRLFDGTYVNITEPTLLIPNSGGVPVIHHKADQKETAHFMECFVSDIAWRITNHEEFSQWKDIVTDIEFFVSPQVWNYNQAVKYDSEVAFFTSNNDDSFTVGRILDSNGKPVNGKDFGFYKISDEQARTTSIASTAFSITVGPVSKNKFDEALTTVSMFNLLASIPLREFSQHTEFAKLKIEDGVLSAIYTQPTLDMSSIVNHDFSSARLLSYNSRLHVTCDAVSPVTPKPITQVNGFSKGLSNYTSAEVCVSIKTERGTRRVSYKIDNPECAITSLPWYYYPDSRAFFAEFIYFGGPKTVKYAIPLEPHPTLPGAYYYNTIRLRDTPTNTWLLSGQPESIFGPFDLLPTSSAIYVSDALNPFRFSASSALTVGEGDILALASASRPLSQGQFGQFPLYAFTTEGVWALETTAQGTYSARQPITRDICISADSICSLDSSVLFATRRGIMQLSGSEATCISEQIQLPVDFGVSQYPCFSAQFANLLGATPAGLALTPSMLAELRMLYDYPGQRVIAFTPGAPLAFSMSLRSGEWSMVTADLHAPINSYPDALALDSERRIVSLSPLSSPSTAQAPVSKASRAQAINPGAGADLSTPLPEEGTATPDVPLDPGTILVPTALPAIALTAPLTLGDRNMLKTIRTLLIDGNFDAQNVKLIIYGSRDLRSWQIVTTRSTAHIRRTILGTGYRYFRICLLASGMAKTDYLTSATIGATPRYK